MKHITINEVSASPLAVEKIVPTNKKVLTGTSENSKMDLSESSTHLDNRISAKPSVQTVSRISPNGCKLTLIFPVEDNCEIRREIARMLIASVNINAYDKKAG